MFSKRFIPDFYSLFILTIANVTDNVMLNFRREKKISAKRKPNVGRTLNETKIGNSEGAQKSMKIAKVLRACFDASSVRKPSTLISVCQDLLTKQNETEKRE